MESACSGIVAGINAAAKVLGLPPVIFPASTVTGALAAYVAHFPGKDFQPMGANFGIVDSSGLFEKKVRDKTEKKRRIAENALKTLRDFADGRGIRDGIVRTS